MAKTSINGQSFENKNAYYRVSVKAKILQGGKLLLVKEDGKKWDLPGGGIEHNETIGEALKRELLEEIGLTDYGVCNGSPQLFKMIDESANRPLIFIVFELTIPEDAELKPSDNVEIGFFEAGARIDTVDYSLEYQKYIATF